MMRSFTTTAIFCASVLSATAAEKPTTTTACMMMLVQIGGEIEAGKVKPDVVDKMKPKAQAMAAQCEAKKFDEAFATYTDIASGIAAGKK